MKSECSNSYVVPFKISSDYYEVVMESKPENINNFSELLKNYPEMMNDHNDLHIYPYTSAEPAFLSVGCNNRCEFCPTAEVFQGNIYYGDPQIILPKYSNKNIHFLDENFFYNDLDEILPLLKKYNIKWAAMGYFSDVQDAYHKYGEDYLFECGLRLIEIGLENIALMRKVDDEGIDNDKIEILYLNLSFLPGETKETIKENAEWMKEHSVNNPIYHNNGMWYSPGQYYYPYGKNEPNGIMLNSIYARSRPTFVPNSLLFQEIEIVSDEFVNKYIGLMYSDNYQLRPKNKRYTIRDFIDGDYKKAIWLTVGLRVGAIV